MFRLASLAFLAVWTMGVFAPVALADYASTILADHPISYWELNDTSGTTAVDQTGTNQGSIQGNVTLGQPGPFSGSGAMAFVQQSSIDLGSAPSLRPTTAPWTIEAWFKATASDAATCANDFGGNHCLLMRAHAFGYDVGMNTDGTMSASVDADSSTSYGVSSSPTAYDDGSWHYLAAVRAPGSITLYIDGKQVAQSPTAESTTFYCCENVVAIANDPACNCSGFTGSLSEMAFYGSALSASQVAAHYAAGVPGGTHVNYGTVLHGIAGIAETWHIPFDAAHTYTFREPASCFHAPGCNIAGLTATTTWGDGTSSQASRSSIACTMQPPPSPMPGQPTTTTMHCVVIATHNYAAAGSYNVTVDVAPIGLIIDNRASIGSLTCLAPGQIADTQFPVVNAPLGFLSLIKPYSLFYGQLRLHWHAIPPPPGDLCGALSNKGALPVFVQFSGEAPVHLVDSVATAELDFFRPGAPPPVCDWNQITHNCSINGDGPLMVRWHTDGFDEQDIVLHRSIFNSGPLTYYYNLDTMSGSINFGTALQTVELDIHETLISHLSLVEQIAVLQEPPADLSVSDRAGRRTGRLTGGRIAHTIPHSRYFTDHHGHSAVVLLAPDDGPYGVTVLGHPAGPYSLTMSTVNVTSSKAAHATHRTLTGTLGRSGTLTVGYAATVPDTPRISRHPTVVARGGRHGARVRYRLPRAVDEAGRSAQVTCQPRSGAVFSTLRTTVTCTARDPLGPVARSTFTVVVRRRR